MKKKFTFLIAALMLLTMMVLPNRVLGEKVTFVAGTDKSSDKSITKGGITIAFTEGTFNRDDNYRCYAGKKMSVSSSVGTITEVILTCTGSGTNDYGPGKFSGTGYTYSGTIGTWTNPSSTELSASTQVRMTKIEVTYTATPSYTINAQSNNTVYGTVSLLGSVITGSPKANCRYATPAYTVSPENSATVTHNGNTFTVTPSANTTVTINFEPIPPHTLSSAVSLSGAGTVTLGSTSVLEGSTTTAEAVVNDGYKFKRWSITGTGASLSSTTENPTTITMGSTDATVTAEFTTATHLIHWSVNGSVIKTDMVADDAAITFTNPSSGVPTGYTFMGWAADEIDGIQGTAPTYVTSATATDEITYYAVMAIENGTTTSTATLTANSSWSSYADKTFTDDKGNTWTANCAGQNSGGTFYYGLKADVSSYIKSPVFSGTITAISVNAKNGSSTEDRIFYIKSTQTGTSGDLGNISVGKNSTGVDCDAVLESSFTTFYLGASAALQFHEISVVYETANYSAFCTTITILSGDITSTVTYDGACAINLSEGATIKTGVVLTVGALGNTDPDALLIEDGGQLITNNAVSATVTKSITAWNQGETNGWYFVSSPINETLNPSNVTNMLTDVNENDRTYDLYSFDATNMVGEESKPWVNYRAHSGEFTIENGMGYLYASEGGTTLEFSGEILPSNSSKTVSDLNANEFNLVGNPYTCEAYVNQSYFTLSQVKGGISSTTTATEASTPISPCTGIVVKPESTSVKFGTSTPVTSANNGNIQMVLAQQVTTRGEKSVQTLDNAIVSFNEGSELGKFYFGQQNANIYIPMDNEEYAIVSAEARGEMPVNFKASQDGQYTITVNSEGVEVGYLHLIDNIAGKDIDLLATPSYTFNAKGDDYESRFRLVFSANSENESGNENDNFAFISDGQLIVTGEGTLQVIDMMGRVISSEMVNGTTSKTIDAKAGVYVLRLINGENVKTQKIVIR